MDVLSYMIAFCFPAFVFIIALCYFIRRPKMDDKLFGYRTARSMENQVAWTIAQGVFGRQLLIGSLVAAVFGYGFLSVSSTILKISLLIIEFIAVTSFGMYTEIILYKKIGKLNQQQQ